MVIREMVSEDIPAGLRLCRSSGWNQLERDWSLFRQLNPASCRVAEKNGRVVGTVATLRYQQRFSWLAMVLVDPEERRAGIGTRLLQEGLILLKDESCVRLDATAAGRELYCQHGFVDEYPLTRFVRSADVPSAGPIGNTVRPMRDEDLPAVLDMDRVMFGADREPVLRSLFSLSPECAWIAATSNIQGYCLGRPGFLFQHLGPVIATEESIARGLVSECLSRGRGQRFGIDTPHSRPSWLDWLHSNGFAKQRCLVRMHRGENRYPGKMEYVFGIVGPEFG